MAWQVDLIARIRRTRMERSISGKRVLFFANCRFNGPATGGSATFARQMVEQFGDKLAVVGLSEKSEPVGKWFERSIGAKQVWFFGVLSAQAVTAERKPWISARVKICLATRFFMRRLRAFPARDAFVHAPEGLFALLGFSWNSVCFFFHGVSNPVSHSRYWCFRWLGKIVERAYLTTLDLLPVQTILAAADRQTIEVFVAKNRAHLQSDRVTPFPTRVDTRIFYPMPKAAIRQELGLATEQKLLAVCGRLCWVKGWDLVLEAVTQLRWSGENVMVVFVGDGEDREKLIARAHELGIFECILITGMLPSDRVAKFLNAADLCVVASHREGWSTAMAEMLACGKAIVSTPVSGASDMVRNGENGYIVATREPSDFAAAIKLGLDLPKAEEVSLRLASRFALESLHSDLAQAWPPLRR